MRTLSQAERFFRTHGNSVAITPALDAAVGEMTADYVEGEDVILYTWPDGSQIAVDCDEVILVETEPAVGPGPVPVLLNRGEVQTLLSSLHTFVDEMDGRAKEHELFAEHPGLGISESGCLETAGRLRNLSAQATALRERLLPVYEGE